MIILKRVIKAKVELGLLLMLAVYMPSLYSFTQSFMVVIDWNDSHAGTSPSLLPSLFFSLLGASIRCCLCCLYTP